METKWIPKVGEPILSWDNGGRKWNRYFIAEIPNSEYPFVVASSEDDLMNSQICIRVQNISKIQTDEKQN